jgi:hypothetical protein
MIIDFSIGAVGLLILFLAGATHASYPETGDPLPEFGPFMGMVFGPYLHAAMSGEFTFGPMWSFVESIAPLPFSRLLGLSLILAFYSCIWLFGVCAVRWHVASSMKPTVH